MCENCNYQETKADANKRIEVLEDLLRESVILFQSNNRSEIVDHYIDRVEKVLN